MGIGIIRALLLAQFVTKAVTTQQQDDAYDYIVVGGGVSGLVVANRLTEDQNGRNGPYPVPTDRLLTCPSIRSCNRKRLLRRQT